VTFGQGGGGGDEKSFHASEHVESAVVSPRTWFRTKRFGARGGAASVVA
jgi:hypothetical protein